MAPSPPRLRILSVGGNAVSAFLSWRLQATNACDVTLVWKAGYEAVSQYGITMRSQRFGNERFKPLSVVRNPEDATSRRGAFDYVLLCVKALPDVYDLASVIEGVVTPQHTCILINTSNTLGVESQISERFPTNVVLSLVSNAEVTQVGLSEFEHNGSTQVWVGPASQNQSIPQQIQMDMAEALAMTLGSGQVDCNVSPNIRQQQFERMIGVLFENSNHAELLGKQGVKEMIEGIIEELLALAKALGCSFPADFKEGVISKMTEPSAASSVMYQDFTARRPMEIETYLGMPAELGRQHNAKVPRIETLYAIMHNLNVVNQQRPANATPAPASAVTSPVGNPPPGPPNPRMSMGPGAVPRPPPHGAPYNGMGRGRTPSMGPPMRRGPPPANGFPSRSSSGYQPRASQQLARRPSFDQNDLDEFAHVVLYDDIPEGHEGDMMNGSTTDLVLRERELALRQREVELRERELTMRGGKRRGKPTPSHHGFDEDDDDDDFFDAPSGPAMPAIDAENFDMMSVTSRKFRKAPDARSMRRDPNMGGMMPPMRQSQSFGGMRPSMNRNRVSTRIMSDLPSLRDSIMDNSLIGMTDNRYGTVDRKTLGDESRANSLTREKLDQLAGGGAGPGGYPFPRRSSISPAEGYGPPGPPSRRMSSRPSPPNGQYLAPNGMPPNGMHPNGMPPNGMGPNGMGPNGRPSPPGGMGRPPPSRHASLLGGAYMDNGVSKAGPGGYPPQKNVRSLTGSASASAGSGESANIESENSAHSSQSSFAPRPPIGVR